MTNRRNFLKKTAVAGAAIANPYIWTSSTANAQDANSKRTIGSIGVGGQRGRYSRGGEVARQAAKLGKTVAVCDVDKLHRDSFNSEFGGKLGTFNDYREMIDKVKPDIVTIGTPDHWHIPIAKYALRAGCDVYCEKPLTLTIQEGIEIRKLVEETNRVFQVGTQQRSEMDLRFLKAVAIVQSGRLGKNVNAYIAIGQAPDCQEPFEPEELPEDFDWDMWLGPAPKVEYSTQRRKMFRWWFEYSGGKMTDWGAHHIDIAQWALGKSNTGPVSAVGTGKFTPMVPEGLDWAAFLNGEITIANGYNTATEFSIDLKFADGTLMQVNDTVDRDDGVQFGNGILFEGEDGRIFVNRGKLQGKVIDDMTEKDHQEIADAMTKLYKGKETRGHMKNFFECVEDRTQPVSDVASHHRTMTSCHLCNIALMLGRELTWNPEAENFGSDAQANALMTRRSRELPFPGA
ncbi:MAG: Gfo/Idh/MocA family oxidoreductase [Planctomycetales bacterium]|nr:Gfo/Idh/MocA family oxidoreductase [Planctomycetales bacterium]